ncbi:MAG: hypothetical protein J6K96_00615 [Treponema sp.]|nr:hypothetical protein [Treponema sp.]
MLKELVVMAAFIASLSVISMGAVSVQKLCARQKAEAARIIESANETD